MKAPGENEPLVVAQEPYAATGPQQEVNPLSSLDHPTDKMIQMALEKLGFYHGKIDGKLGRKSKKAIREFQAQNKLAVDGKVGQKTWSLLKKVLEEPVQE